MEYLQSFHFVIKHNFEKLNQGADAISRRHLLLIQVGACIRWFEHLRELYREDQDFGGLFEACLKHPKGDFYIQDGYLFKGDLLYVPKCGARELILREVHGGSLVDTLGKTRPT